jgi:hypothetical protein
MPDPLHKRGPHRPARRAVAVIGLAMVMVAATGCFGLDPRSGAGNGFAYITAVRGGASGGYDRVVVDFASAKLPDWKVHLDAPPFTADGSGNAVAVSGHAYISVKMTNADAHTFYAGPYRFSPPGTPNVTEVVRISDFEGHVDYVIGLNDLRRFQVTVLQSPSRLVIDVQR